jgi:hypothetical protein
MSFYRYTQHLLHMVIVCTLSVWTIGVQAQNDAPVIPGTITDTTQYISGFNPKSVPPVCNYPEITLVTTVQYQTKAIAQVTIKSNGLRTDNLAFSTKGDGRLTPIRSTGDGKTALLDNLQKNQVYQIKGYNTCGQQVVLAEFNTYPFRSGQDPIRVSDALFGHLSRYTALKDKAQPLHTFVANLPNVTVEEKSSFLQKMIAADNPFPNESIGTIPIRYITGILDGTIDDTGGNDPSPCMCEFVVNQGSYAIPDAVAETNFIERVNDYSNGAWSTSRWWWESREGGNAKYQQIATDGWKENLGEPKGKVFERGASGQNSNMSPNYAKLSYTFLCVNFPAATPTECGCDKKIRVSAEYVSKVDVRATTRSGWHGKKKAHAQVSDFAAFMVVKHNEPTVAQAVEVVSAGSNVFTAECEGGTAVSDVLDSVSNVVGSITSVIAAINTGQIQDIGQSSASLLGSVGGVFKVFEQIKPCTPSINAQNTLVQNSKEIVLKPNQPISIALLSGSRLEAGGFKSWDSHARINSDFYMTGILLGSNSATGEEHCCTDYSAQWVYATENRPSTALTIPVNNFIFSNMNGAGNITINGVPSFGSNFTSGTEIGHATADFPGCTKKVPIYNFK